MLRRPAKTGTAYNIREKKMLPDTAHLSFYFSPTTAGDANTA